MSAICGIYYQKDEPVCLEIGAAMLDGFKQYHADDRGTWLKGPVFLGCHAQHITPESVNEKLPYYDEQADLVITADAIIDNRQELFDRLTIPYGQRESIPDSILILEAYKRWGKDCPKYLIGDFTFVVWDGRHREVFCAVDAMGTRTLYYSYRAGIFAFSTLIKPLFVVGGIERKYNDMWIVDFLAMPSCSHQLDPELTLYEGIYLLPAGHTLIAGAEGINKSLYWQVTRQPELKLSSDDEYEEAFREVFDEAVRCRMRSRRPVGVMMSGGLDSTSVACMAARELATKGQRLQAFSAVPMEGYRDWLQPKSLADETPYIEAIKEYAENIDVMYCRSEGRHSLSDTSQIFDMLEHPYKSFENFFWIESILDAARDVNIGVMLHGGGGNYTVSWGDIDSYVVGLVKKRQWSLLLREAKAYAVRKQRPFGRVLVGLLLQCMPHPIQKNVFKLRNGDASDVMKLSPINRDFIRSQQVAQRFRQFDLDPLFVSPKDSFVSRREMLDKAFSSHTASVFTKQSLAYRVAMRDPTTDRRVIEFCLSLPDNQYVRDGEERRFIRRSMEGILPDKVRLNESIYGQQSADWLQRLLPFWKDITVELQSIGKWELEGHYLDIPRIQQKTEEMGIPSHTLADDFTMRMLMRALIFSRFLRGENYDNVKGGDEICRRKCGIDRN